MNESPELQNERMSAFVDGELSSSEQEVLSRRLENDPELRLRMGRYQQISFALRRSQEQTVDASGIAEAVSQALLDEPTVLAPRKPAQQLPRVALGAALAATVAAIAIGVAPSLLEPEVGNESQPQSFAFAPRLSVPPFPTTKVALGDTATIENRPAGERWKTLRPETQHKLDNYLLEHNEFAGRLGVTPANAHVGFVTAHDD
jgi:sigma-E factor negative regulatory protein RseA